jgi:hypothetical protein
MKHMGLRQILERKRAEKLKVVRDEKAELDRFRRAYAIVEPILQAHPGWTWSDSVKWIKDNGLLPPDRSEPDRESILRRLKEEADRSF